MHPQSVLSRQRGPGCQAGLKRSSHDRQVFCSVSTFDLRGWNFEAAVVRPTISDVHEQRWRTCSGSGASTGNLSRRRRTSASKGRLETHPRSLSVKFERTRTDGVHEAEVFRVRFVEGDLDRPCSSGSGSGQSQDGDQHDQEGRAQNWSAPQIFCEWVSTFFCQFYFKTILFCYCLKWKQIVVCKKEPMYFFLEIYLDC